MAEVDRIKVTLGVQAQVQPVRASKPLPKATSVVCPHCSAAFDKPLKFCGECGKPMKAVTA
jgi:rRNA maturation endonuclease Nob1